MAGAGLAGSMPCHRKLCLFTPAGDLSYICKSQTGEFFTLLTVSPRRERKKKEGEKKNLPSPTYTFQSATTLKNLV